MDRETLIRVIEGFIGPPYGFDFGNEDERILLADAILLAQAEEREASRLEAARKGKP